MSKPWFGPKRVGWGASPVSWQGWAATGAYVALLALVVREPSLDDLLRGAAIGGLTLGFLALVRWKYGAAA
jgi:uncharacterized membrane protein YkvI